MIYLPLLIPFIGLIALVYALARQRKIDRLYLQAVEDMNREMSAGCAQLKTVARFLSEGYRVPCDSEIKFVGDGFLVLSGSDGSETVELLPGETVN